MPDTSTEKAEGTSRKRLSFAWVLFGVGFFLLIQPLLVEVRLKGGLATGFVGLFFPLFSVYVARDRRRQLVISCILAALSILGNARHLALPEIGTEQFGMATALAFTGYTTYIVLSAVLRRHIVTLDVVAGALAGYLMLGVSWALVHLLVDQVTASAYSSSFIDAAGYPDFPKAVYFSFITLLTIGYGDIVPTGTWARSLTILEGAAGFVYSTVVVAWLMANYISEVSRRRQRPE